MYDWRSKGGGGVGELLTAAESSVMDDRVMTLPGDDGTGPTQAPRRIGKLRRSNKTKTNTRSAALISRCQQLRPAPQEASACSIGAAVGNTQLRPEDSGF